MKKMLALSISTCTQCPWYNKTPPRCKHPDWSGPAPLQEDPLLLEGPVCWDQHCPLPSEPCALNDLLQNLAEQMPFQPFFVKEAFNNNPGPPMESLEQVIADKAAALIDKRKIAEMTAQLIWQNFGNYIEGAKVEGLRAWLHMELEKIPAIGESGIFSAYDDARREAFTQILPLVEEIQKEPLELFDEALNPDFEETLDEDVPF